MRESKALARLGPGMTIAVFALLCLPLGGLNWQPAVPAMYAHFINVGLADAAQAHIDPVSCPNGDPRIRILASQLEEDPDLSPGEFGNSNNHSLGVRVDFGQSSFLITGDLEEPAIETLLEWYDGTDLLDIDVRGTEVGDFRVLHTN